jgi:hypothetical protein
LKFGTVLPYSQTRPEAVLMRNSVTAWETVRSNAFQSRQNLLNCLGLCLEIFLEDLVCGIAGATLHEKERSPP